jgi:hypothetical protein
MNVESIKVNGITWHEPAKNIIPHLTTQIGLYRMRFTDKEIFNKFPKNDDHYLGRRYSTDGDVAIRIAGAIVESAADQYVYSNMGRNSMETEQVGLLIEGIIESWFDSLSASEIDVLIQEGLRCCASADHWYTFEKEWE